MYDISTHTLMYFVCVSLFQTELTSFFYRVGIAPGHLRMHVWVCFSPSLLWVFQRGQCHHQRHSCQLQKRHLLSQPASKRSEVKPKLGVSGMLTNTIIILVCLSVDITAFSFYCSQWVEINTVFLKKAFKIWLFWFPIRSKHSMSKCTSFIPVWGWKIPCTS